MLIELKGVSTMESRQRRFFRWFDAMWRVIDPKFVFVEIYVQPLAYFAQSLIGSFLSNVS